MNSEYLDTSQKSSEQMKSIEKWTPEMISDFDKNIFPTLTNLQSAYLQILAKKKTRILIECESSQGKSSCYFFSLISNLLGELEEFNEQEGKFI